MVGLTSAAGIVGFLSEPDTELQVFALQTLNEKIDSLWTEVAPFVGEIEALYEDESFPERQLAALVAAKVYYNLQEYDESMIFALGAGKLFEIDKGGEFEDTIISNCVDKYIMISALRNPEDGSSTTDQAPTQLATAFTSVADGAASTSVGLTSPTTPFSQSTLPSKSLLSRQDSMTLDPTSTVPTQLDGATPPTQLLNRSMQKQLHYIIEELFERCYQQGRYRQVVGIAVEARNLDKLRQALLRASEDQKKGKFSNGLASAEKSEDLMEYVLDVCMGVVQERTLRNEILRLILDLLHDIPSPDYFSIAKCVIYLNEHTMASDMLSQLVKKADPKALAIAYQIAFDMYDNSTQEFLKKVRQELPKPAAPSSVIPPTANGDADAPGSESESKPSDQLLGELQDAAGVPIGTVEKLSPEAEKAFASIGEILQGTRTIELDLEFLYRNNRTDMSILNKLKDSLEARNSIFHTAVTLANAFMHAGTTNDRFFRDNLEWLAKAVNWSKFTATAALGVIHRGNLSQGQRLLEPYLPRDQIAGSNTGSAYSQGGSLYALGLIYANHETHALDLIRGHFKKASEEVVLHGGALGLGAAGMATGDEGIYEDLKAVLYTDSALNGEAVGIAMGLIMLGTGNIKALKDMFEYAHDTQHEKIVRGLALGMALIMYGRQEGADELVSGLLEDPDPILRYGGIQTLALAYCGTSSNKAVRKLLHVAVSDASDDVRRIAVMSLGFILFRKPHSVPRMVELLSESYNPHVRYGAAMALGISCAGTGLDEAIDLLEPMIKDPTDFVRQGALIALSMIMVQQNEAMNPKVGTIRKTLQKAIGDRHEDAMTKFGSAVSLGIIDAGGRNSTISLQTQTGNLNMAAIVGMAVFTQYWYWFPLTHFLCLSFTPTSVIALDQDLEVPSLKFHSATRPSLFDYPPEQETKGEAAVEKVKTAVLSTTAQAKRRAQKKEKQQRRESMDIDQTPTTPKTTTALYDRMDTDEPALKDEKKSDDEKRETESAIDESVTTTKKGASDETSKESSAPIPELRRRMEKEKVGYELENMSRVLPAQLKFISFPDSRYTPVKKPTGGILLVTDSQPSEAKSLLELKAKKPTATATAAKPLTAPQAGGASSAGAGPSTPANQGRVNQALFDALGGRGAGSSQAEQQDVEMGGVGAQEAVGVLTAVDEDGEGGEEAEVPGAFEYESDGEGDES
ncbi:proteasome regulatory particle base subunit [Agyrium rufum]|nr:proteasome regulatory particle base subunit [Agyrium rufum]